MIMNLFSSRPDHPLADPKELKRILSELPLDNAFKSVDELFGWFESMQHADDFRVDQYFEIIRQLDEAAQQHLRKLARDYLHSPRLSRAEERRLWEINYNYWGEAAVLYQRCVDKAALNPKDKSNEAFKNLLPLAASRLLAARVTQLKWVEFRYGPVESSMWLNLGQPYLQAEADGYAHKPVQLYPAQPTMTSVAQQYVQSLVFFSSSMDSLMPREIELADRLIAHFLPGFIFTPDCRRDSVYWADAESGEPPVRLARQPDKIKSSMRFFSPGTARQALNDLIHIVERGEVPKDLALGGEYPAKLVLPVLQHLAVYWAPDPPQREHQRHPVKTRLSVLQGFDDCFTVFAGEVARAGKARNAESWVVENVSLGGFGAGIEDLSGDWLRIGALLCMQPDGGDNWVLGVVRRFNKDSDTRASVGIQSLSRKAQSIELRPRTSGLAVSSAITGIWLCEASTPGEARMVMPTASFDLRESLEFSHEDKRYLLTPVELEESGSNFEIGRYRQHLAE